MEHWSPSPFAIGMPEAVPEPPEVRRQPGESLSVLADSPSDAAHFALVQLGLAPAWLKDHNLLLNYKHKAAALEEALNAAGDGIENLLSRVNEKLGMPMKSASSRANFKSAIRMVVIATNTLPMHFHMLNPGSVAQLLLNECGNPIMPYKRMVAARLAVRAYGADETVVKAWDAQCELLKNMERVENLGRSNKQAEDPQQRARAQLTRALQEATPFSAEHMYCLFGLHEARRTGELNHMLIRREGVEDERVPNWTEYNHVFVPRAFDMPCRLAINKHKTSELYGPIHKQLHPDISACVRAIALHEPDRLALFPSSESWAGIADVPHWSRSKGLPGSMALRRDSVVSGYEAMDGFEEALHALYKGIEAMQPFTERIREQSTRMSHTPGEDVVTYFTPRTFQYDPELMNSLRGCVSAVVSYSLE